MSACGGPLLSACNARWLGHSSVIMWLTGMNFTVKCFRVVGGIQLGDVTVLYRGLLIEIMSRQAGVFLAVVGEED